MGEGTLDALDSEGAAMKWNDIRDRHGAVLESDSEDCEYRIVPMWGNWECKHLETGFVLFTHPQLSVAKRIAADRIEADRKRAPR